MAKGGPRPNGGPKKKFFYIIGEDRFGSIKEAAESKGVSIASISSWCNGGREDCYKETLGGERIVTKKKKAKNALKKTQKEKLARINQPDVYVSPTDKKQLESQAASKNMTPLDFFLSIMNDVNEDKELRIKVAYYAAPYIHPKGSDKKGKKEEQEDRAKKASRGRFAAGKPPLSLVKGTK